MGTYLIMPRNMLNNEPVKPKFWEFWKRSQYKKELVAYKVRKALLADPEAIKALRLLDLSWHDIKKTFLPKDKL